MSTITLTSQALFQQAQAALDVWYAHPSWTIFVHPSGGYAVLMEEVAQALPASTWEQTSPEELEAFLRS